MSKEECREVIQYSVSKEECIEVGEYHGGVYREIGECLRRSAMRLGIYTKEECI